MVASRTRKTRAVVSYKVDDSSDESDDDAPFTVARGTKTDASRHSSGGEGELGNGKGRRTLALKKNRSQAGGAGREEEPVPGGKLDQNEVREELELSALGPSLAPTESEAVAGRLSPETKIATAFEHLVDVAFEATDLCRIDSSEHTGGPVEGKQLQSEEGVETAQQTSNLDRSNDLRGDGRQPGSAGVVSAQDDSSLVTRKKGGPHPRRPSEDHEAASDDDDWLEEDVVDCDTSDSSTDLSSEDASDSDLDMERPAKKRQTLAKKPPSSTSRTYVRKGPRSKSSGADLKVSSSSKQKVESRKPPPKPAGRRKEMPRVYHPVQVWVENHLRGLQLPHVHHVSSLQSWA
ncbi:hypothetical protein MPTK1_1g21120 [Marchantia polymorpha subsp. ruderalis]|uniref:Uncharacterized protein n=2 Tax=Marchantia polymorpha TaxID=3197 RepID=A0AAF6ASJ2_MARPO|nr:hypothetical protein MARPO_0001s0446 [Marchantia polymorpha]BBM99412.1 hypothetical protein Mp_1g21120 [Marchantia polymorpha subsp. ruderalis]|eukprot:PTQ50492.1 hypothetical protein MARPO_0001s0446 [Marchantia polymorpha]